jgi:hypothetical protein
MQFSCPVMGRASSLSLPIIVLPLSREVAGQSDQGCQSEKGRATMAANVIFRRSCENSYLTMTQPGCSSGKAIRPTTAVAAMRSGLLTFQRNKTVTEATPMSAVSHAFVP